MSFYNRMGNVGNQYQTDVKKVLCVCSAGLLRSPTMAVVLSQEPYNYNTRAAGISEEFALIPVDEVLIHWADEIICAESWMAQEIDAIRKEDIPIYSLNLPDIYEYRNPELMKLIKDRYDTLCNPGRTE